MMFGSIVAVIVAGALNVGGIGKVFEIAGDGDRLHLFEMSPGKIEILGIHKSSYANS